jgi:HEAT repeat protein
MRAARRLGTLPESQAREALVPLLKDAIPGVRSAAAAGLGGHGDPSALTALELQLVQERCTWPLIAAAVAWVRCGGSLSQAQEALAYSAESTVQTVYGPRNPSATTETSTRQVQHWFHRCLFPFAETPPLLESGERPPSRSECRSALLDSLNEPNAALKPKVLEALALQQHPDDFATLERFLNVAGRRGGNALLLSIGLHGDPRWVPLFRNKISDVSVDPSRGFAWRRISGIGLGRIGSPDAAGILLRALKSEAQDFEGRPGAGLGIQYPVRTVLLWALGECGATSCAKELASYLGNVSGSALGGFYLAAMEGLAKLPIHAVQPVMQRKLGAGDPIEAAHALSVWSLVASPAVARDFEDDAREPVRTIAKAILNSKEDKR